MQVSRIKRVNFLISEQKHMLLVHKRVVLMSSLYIFFRLTAQKMVTILFSKSGIIWAYEGLLYSWLSFVVSYCEFVTFPLVSWVRCGT